MGVVVVMVIDVGVLEVLMGRGGDGCSHVSPFWCLVIHIHASRHTQFTLPKSNLYTHMRACIH